MDLVWLGLIVISKRIGFLVIDERRSLKFQSICEYICSFLDREVQGLKYLSGSQSFPSQCSL